MLWTRREAGLQKCVTDLVDSHSLMRKASGPGKLNRGRGGDGPRRTRFRDDGNYWNFGHAQGDHMDDAELTGTSGFDWRPILPYLAIMVCVAVAGWLAWGWLL